MYPKIDYRAKWEADGYDAKPWFDFAQLLDAYFIEVGTPDDSLERKEYLAEEARLLQIAKDKFYENIHDNPRKIADLRKLLVDLAWWNNTTKSELWGFISKMDDNTMIAVTYPLFPMLWD